MTYELQLLIGSTWTTPGISTIGGLTPYRFQDRADAEDCLRRCFAAVPWSKKRVVETVIEIPATVEELKEENATLKQRISELETGGIKR